MEARAQAMRRFVMSCPIWQKRLCARCHPILASLTDVMFAALTDLILASLTKVIA